MGHATAGSTPADPYWGGGSPMITVSGPLTDKDGKIIGVLGLDIGFEDFAKIEEEEDV